MALRETLPERYRDMIALYARGHASSAEILKTDFGHWPPNNLDIVRTPDIDVEFKSALTSPYALTSAIPKWYEAAFLVNILLILYFLFNLMPLIITSNEAFLFKESLGLFKLFDIIYFFKGGKIS